jgi:hypothetical protein
VTANEIMEIVRAHYGRLVADSHPDGHGHRSGDARDCAAHAAAVLQPEVWELEPFGSLEDVLRGGLDRARIEAANARPDWRGRPPMPPPPFTVEERDACVADCAAALRAAGWNLDQK